MLHWYLIRHAQAEAIASSDAERKLTPMGINQCGKAAESLAKVRPDLILVSPYVRAQQTAELICTHNNIESQRLTCHFLTPDQQPQRVSLQVEAQLEQGVVWLISHNPLMTDLLNYMLNGRCDGGYGMDTASVACLAFTETVGAGCAELVSLQHVT